VKRPPSFPAKLRNPVAMALVLTCLLTAPAPMAPISPLCENGSYRTQHPLICNTGEGFPGQFPGSTGGGNSDHGGLLGGLLGGLTGGLL